jgi:hypothetical protein
VDLWFSGSNTTAVIEIRDVNKDTNGNDFGLDDLYIGTCAVSLTVNDITNGMMSNAAPARSVLPLNATVTNGPPVGSYTIQTLPDPATGILYLNGLPVIPGQIITIAEASLLQFDPVAGYVGNAVFTYSGSDTSGAGSNNIATFTIPIDNTPLPVELTDFEAAVNNRDAHLTWHTASEKNSDHFDIERSFDGKSFARVSAVAGQGNTTRPTAYAYTDAGVGRSHNGTVYYRLRQVDHDGTATHSPVRSVVFKESASIALSFYPNPTTGSGTLDLSKLPTGSYQVTVVDATGRQVLSTALSGGEQHPMALDGLARGNYLLVVRGRGGLKLSQRVVRE